MKKFVEFFSLISSIFNHHSGRSFFSNLNTPIMKVTMEIPTKIANFHAKAMVPSSMETVSKSEIMEK